MKNIKFIVLLIMTLVLFTGCSLNLASSYDTDNKEFKEVSVESGKYYAICNRSIENYKYKLEETITINFDENDTTINSKDEMNYIFKNYVDFNKKAEETHENSNKYKNDESIYYDFIITSKEKEIKILIVNNKQSGNYDKIDEVKSNEKEKFTCKFVGKENSEEKEENNNSTNKKLISKNNYRFKNTVNKVTLYFDEIKVVNNIEGIKPVNDLFLVMKITAETNLGFETSHSYYFPFEIYDSKGNHYLSLNSDYVSYYHYEDKDGNNIDIPTLLNKDYSGVSVDNGKVRASVGLDYVKAGDGTRYIIFDIKSSTAEDKNAYLIFNGTKDNYHKEDVEDINIYFYDYIEK